MLRILFFFFFVSAAFSSIIKIPPTNISAIADVSYDELACTQEDREKIAFLITTMGENGKIALLFKARELRRIGDEILHVHPLRFLGVVFSNPILINHMREIYNDYFKWNEFIDGLGTSLTAQANRDKLNCYLNDFSKEINILPDNMKHFIAAREWERFVLFLMTPYTIHEK